MNLGTCPLDTDAVVTSVDIDGTLGNRLAELGLRPGASIRTTQRASFGSRVVALGADRFALDRATCRRIEVSLA